MTLCFTLSMPGKASWNGKWGDNGVLYAVTRSVEKMDAALANQLIARSFTYRWSDGWVASVSVNLVTALEASRIRKKSKGFCGYEWMVDSLLKYGKIYASHEERTATV